MKNLKILTIEIFKVLIYIYIYSYDIRNDYNNYKKYIGADKMDKEVFNKLEI